MEDSTLETPPADRVTRSAVPAPVSPMHEASEVRRPTMVCREGVDARRLRQPGVAFARTPCRRPGPDVGSRQRRADGPAPAVPRADPPGAEGRRVGAVE